MTRAAELALGYLGLCGLRLSRQGSHLRIEPRGMVTPGAVCTDYYWWVNTTHG